MEERKNHFDIELSREVAQGTYANLAILAHSSSEFIIDFIRMMPGMPKAEVKSRIIITPEHAKRLWVALQENIRNYEQTFGRINMPEESPLAPPFPIDMGLKGQA